MGKYLYDNIKIVPHVRDIVFLVTRSAMLFIERKNKIVWK